MTAVQFDRNAQAHWYAQEHLQTDPGIQEIYYLPKDAPDREIRLVEVNSQMLEFPDSELEPIDYGVDRGSDNAHSLVVLDVSPEQWQRISTKRLPLPLGWSLEGWERIAR